MKGFVYDQDGGAITGAVVTVTSPSLIGELSTLSGESGYYRFINLPPGKYRMVVSRENYQQSELQGLNVHAGVVSNINVTLTVGEFSKKVVITWDAQILDGTSSVHGFNIDGDFLKRVPLTYDREWDSVWSLVPGVVNEGQYGPYGNRVDVHGAGIFGNVWNLDGMNIGSTFTGANNLYFSTDIVEEVHIVTSGMDASAPATQGGYINVVSKSGGNEFNGSLSLTFQLKDWNWSNVEGGTAARQGIVLPEFSLGGPIVRDRTWFFSAYRYNDRDEEYSFSAADLARFALLDISAPDQPRKTRGHLFFGKITHAVADSMKLALTFNSDKSHEYNADMYANGSNNTGIDIASGGQFWGLIAENAWSSNFSSTLKLSWYDADNIIFGEGGQNEPSITRYSMVSLNSVGNLTGSGDVGYYNNRSGYAWGSDTSNRRLEFRGDARYYLERFVGSHDLGFGISATPIQQARSNTIYASPYRILEARNSSGEWVPFYKQVFDGTSVLAWLYRQQRYAAYFQDAWVLNDRLTVNAGVRAENLQDGVALNVTGLSPFIGFNYAVSGDLTDSVRFSYSLRRRLVEGREGQSVEDGGALGYTVLRDNNLDGTWDKVETVAGRQRKAVNSADLTSNGYPMRYDPDLGIPFAHEFQFGYTRLLPWDMKFDLAGVYKIYGDDWVLYNENLIFRDGSFAGLRDESVLNRYVFTNNRLSSKHYNSLELTFTKEFSSGWQLMASYTWQHSVLKGQWRPDEAYRYLHPASWFESVNDNLRPHVLRISASAILPGEFTLSANLLAQSGVTDGAALLQRGTGVGAPEYVTLTDGSQILNPLWGVSPLYRPRSEGREVTMDNLLIVNFGLGKDFTAGGQRFQAQAQVFNLFNNDSYTLQSGNNSYVKVDGSPLYSRNYSWIQPPRAVQVFIKYLF